MLSPDEQTVAKAAEVASVSPERWVSIAVGIMAIVAGVYAFGVWLTRPIARLRADHNALDALVATMKSEDRKRLDQVEADVEAVQAHLNMIPTIQDDVAVMKRDTAVMAADARSAKETAERTETSVAKLGDQMLRIAGDIGEVKGALGRTRGASS
jgi:hypothetical protein